MNLNLTYVKAALMAVHDACLVIHVAAFAWRRVLPAATAVGERKSSCNEQQGCDESFHEIRPFDSVGGELVGLTLATSHRNLAIPDAIVPPPETKSV